MVTLPHQYEVAVPDLRLSNERMVLVEVMAGMEAVVEGVDLTGAEVQEVCLQASGEEETYRPEESEVFQGPSLPYDRGVG